MRKRGPRERQPIVRILLEFLRRRRGRLAIRRRHDHQLEQLLDVPARFAEFDGQPIEQFGMRRQFAGDAEIAGRPHEAGAEHFLPESIDGDARRERILGPQQPLAPGRADCCGRSAGKGGSSGGRAGVT